MKNLNYLNQFRIEFRGMMGDEFNGLFIIKLQGQTFKVLASNGGGWHHVSVSNEHHIPSWMIMCKIKEMFFGDD